MLGATGAMVSLLAIAVGAPMFGQRTLEFIRVYLTFPNREQALGPEHPHVAQSHNNLGNVIRAQGKYAEAEAEHRQALALREKALGPEHPDVATSHNDLGIIFADQGKTREALLRFGPAVAPSPPLHASPLPDALAATELVVEDEGGARSSLLFAGRGQVEDDGSVLFTSSLRDGDHTSRTATWCSFNPPFVSGGGKPL